MNVKKFLHPLATIVLLLAMLFPLSVNAAAGGIVSQIAVFDQVTIWREPRLAQEQPIQRLTSTETRVVRVLSVRREVPPKKDGYS